MRIESSVTAISWIPSEAVSGMPKLPFQIGIGHYDDPPPERLAKGDLEQLRDADGFREANELEPGSRSTTARSSATGSRAQGSWAPPPSTLASKTSRFPASPSTSSARSRKCETTPSASSRRSAGAPASPAAAGQGQPVLRIQSATAWTTLALTIHADGSSHHELVGASGFPRHWIYDRDGNLTEKSGTVDFKTWYREAHATTRPGATRTPRRSRPPRRPPSSASSRAGSCRAGWRSGASSSPARTWSSRARPGTSCTCSSTVCSRSPSTARRSARSGRRDRWRACAARRWHAEGDVDRSYEVPRRGRSGRHARTLRDGGAGSDPSGVGLRHRASWLGLERRQGGDACRDRHHPGDLNAREPFPKHDICR